MWSNSDFKTWIGAVNALSLSQDVLKEEAIKFSPVFADLDKKTVLKRVEDFLKGENRKKIKMFCFIVVAHVVV